MCFWRLHAQASLYLEGRELDWYNLRLMLKISFAGRLDLSPAILAQYTLEIYVATQNCKKGKKTLFWGFKVVQGHRC